MHVSVCVCEYGMSTLLLFFFFADLDGKRTHANIHRYNAIINEYAILRGEKIYAVSFFLLGNIVDVCDRSLFNTTALCTLFLCKSLFLCTYFQTITIIVCVCVPCFWNVCLCFLRAIFKLQPLCTLV